METPNLGYGNDQVWLRKLAVLAMETPRFGYEKVWLRKLAALAMKTPRFGYGKSLPKGTRSLGYGNSPIWLWEYGPRSQN